ncbi:MAG: helix-hairpin-helix domain-containing protein [Prevotellaceae bacterium]|nr:helix-hairpin-helix domain-containing protein [Prevotellaceae bacterium]
MTRVALASLLFLLSAALRSQTRELYTDWDTFLSEFLDSETASGDDDDTALDALCQHLELLAAAPLDLNAATREDLLGLPFLNETQADSLLRYRERRGRFVTLGELMFVTGLDARTRRWLSLFVRLLPETVPPAPLRQRLFGGRHRLETRLDIPLYTRAGDPRGPSDYPSSHPQNAFLGNRLTHVLRYRYDEPAGLVRYGLTLEKDAFEPFGTDGTRPYDYVSAYVSLRPPSRRWQLLAGDFEVHFGQGLLLGSGFLPVRRAAVVRGGNGDTPFRPHTSTDENRFFRGVASEVRASRLRMQLFGSLSRRDATALGGDSVTTWLTSGLHRSPTERARRHNVQVVAGGARIGWHSQFFSLAAGGYGAKFDKTFAPPARTYNKYYLRGRRAGGIQTDYRLSLRRFSATGEAAFDGRLHPATVHTLRFTPRDGLSLTASGRMFSPRYVEVFGSYPAENSRLQNEYGLLLGFSCTRSRRLAFEAFADVFRFPRAAWRAALPSNGFRAWAEIRYETRRSLALSLRYKAGARACDVPAHDNLLAYEQTHRLRLRADAGGRRFRVSAAADGVVHTSQLSAAVWGWMLSLRCSTKEARRLRATLYGALFSGDRSDAVLYAFEPALRYQYGLAAYRGRGFVSAAVAEIRLARKLTGGVRVACLRYFDRDTQSSGAMQIFSPAKADLALQLQWTL